MCKLAFHRCNTRGCRNNNPMNIRRSKSAWRGKVPFSRSSDLAFEQFEDMECGVRAAAKLLYRYIKVYRLQSVYSIIHRWAPASDNNDTASYVKFVSDRLFFRNINPYYVHADIPTISALIVAMSYQESSVLFVYDNICQFLSKTKLY